tara:strand:+ start:620 stop:763 length:144 start_codon:yes stop_codon:yes gene_type:complete
MFNKNLCFYFFLLLLPVVSISQDCKLTVSGVVKDLSTDKPIIFANVI